MPSALDEPPPDRTPISLVPQYDDASDTASDISMLSTTHGPASSDGRSSPILSDGRSIYSYTSSIDRTFILKDVHGRQLNSTCDLYLMPADVDEHGRLDIQHEMLKVKMGLYWEADHVRRILAPRPDGCEQPAILDIGTGSGSWAVDMAEEFPHAEVLGIDLAPANLAKSSPPNCRFECDDVNQGLGHYKNVFDVIHMRCVCQGVEDCQAFFSEIFDLLRPGGIFLLVEGWGMHGENQTMLTQAEENESDPAFSWMAMYTQKMINIISERAAKISPGKKEKMGANSTHLCQEWLKEMPVWEAQDHRKILIELGPWKPNMSGRDRYAAELQRQNFFRMCASWRPTFLEYGYPEEVVDEWIAKARDEMVNLRAHTYVGTQASWALKPGTLGGVPA